MAATTTLARESEASGKTRVSAGMAYIGVFGHEEKLRRRRGQGRALGEATNFGVRTRRGTRMTTKCERRNDNEGGSDEEEEEEQKQIRYEE